MVDNLVAFSGDTGLFGMDIPAQVVKEGDEEADKASPFGKTFFFWFIFDLRIGSGDLQKTEVFLPILQSGSYKIWSYCMLFHIMHKEIHPKRFTYPFYLAPLIALV